MIKSGRFRTRLGRSPYARWSIEEIQLLRKVYPKVTRRQVLKLLPGRLWWSIERKAQKIGLKRPVKAAISITLHRQVDVGFSAGMIIADGSVMEKLVSSGTKRGTLEGCGERSQRWTSMPAVQVSMEDKASLNRLGAMWGSSTIFDQKSSVGNDVWRVYVCGRKARDLLKIVLPYLAGKKRKRALYILKKYRKRTSIPVDNSTSFIRFEGLE